jgi:alpha-mannosidase/mannosylglycerate hydrolase
MPDTQTPERTLHVISHTHWDREWYLTFQQFRFRLVQLIDRLMDLLDRDPDFKYFHLDAQTIAIEDYLEIKPKNRERLLKFVREGRILTGPWYEQNDVYLTSGEATIRNLLVGHRMAEEYGGPGSVMKIGYLPDQFGLISQLPQILRGFGIATAVHGRGRAMPKDGPMEYWWESPDGSRVLTSFMAFWYNNFERIPNDLEAAIARVDELENKYMAPVSASRNLLFMNGVDHFEAQENLAPMMKAVNAKRAGGRLVQSTLPAYFEALAAENLDLPVEKGERRNGPSLGGLPGTLSSRVNLKQRNARCQTLLEKYAEPLCSVAATLGAEYPKEYLTYAWKLLMQTHPHDSICGCSQDQVHREMLPRLDQVEQVADELIARAFAACASHLPPPAPIEAGDRQTTFAVFNPLSFPRTDIAEVTLDFPLGAPSRSKCIVDESTDVTHLAVFDADGNEVTSHIVSSEIAQTRVLSATVLPMAQTVRRFVVQVRAADVPPVGFKAFRAVASSKPIAGHGNAGSTVGTGAVGQGSSPATGANYFENAVTEAVLLAGGTFQPSIKRQVDGEDDFVGYEWMGMFEDGGDVGDQYVYRKPRRDVVVTSTDISGQWELVEDTPLAAAYRCLLVLEVPASARPDREGRSRERVTLPVETTVRLRADQPIIEVATTVQNTALYHRLRVRFPSVYDLWFRGGVQPPQTAIAEIPFDVVERSRVSPEELVTVAGQQPHHQWVGVRVEDEEHASSLTILTDGLYEHELLRDDHGTLAITLLRGADRLNMVEHDPLGHDRASDGQALGTHTFRYALMGHSGTWEEEKVWRDAAAFNAPLLAMQTPEAERENPDYNARPLAGPRETTPIQNLTLEPDTMVLSAYKQAEDRDTQIVRFWNIGTKMETATAGIPGAKQAWRVNMNEERQDDLPIMENGTVSFDVKPKEIVTVEFIGG